MTTKKLTRLKAFMRERNVKVYALCDATGISRAVLSRYRGGTASPRATTIVKIVTAVRSLLGEKVRANQLFYLGDDEVESPLT